MKHGQLEGLVFTVVAAADEPVTVATVTEAIRSKGRWAYTTVKGILDRLVDKDILNRTQCKLVPKRYVYIVAQDPRVQRLADFVAGWCSGDVEQAKALLNSLAPSDIQAVKRHGQPAPRGHVIPQLAVGYVPPRKTAAARMEERELIG